MSPLLEVVQASYSLLLPTGTLSNNYGAATFAFVGSKIWENIPSKLKKLPYNNFCKH